MVSFTMNSFILKNQIMKKLLFFLLEFSFILPVTAKVKKPKQDVFPNGEPITEWFTQSGVSPLDSLGKIYNIADYGAVSDPNIVQTELIQSVIDKTAANGGGVVFIPEGIYKSGSLFFKQGVHLYLTRGAVLLGSEKITDFPVIMTRIEGQYCKYFGALINAENLDGFTISGSGTIDGNGTPYWKAFRLRRQWNPKCTNKDEMRPRLLFVSNCRNVQISDVTLQNSPFWTSHYYRCDRVKLINLRIYSPVKPIASASADGIDMDVCSNFLIKRCKITVNDDAICFKGGKGPEADKDPNNGPNKNILVEDCLFDHTTGSCMTCGSESVRVSNVLMRNCQVNGGSSLLLLKMRPDTPQHYEYITVDRVKGFCREMLSLISWKQFFDLNGKTEIPKSYGTNVTMSNLDLDCDKFIGVEKNEKEYELSEFRFKDLNVKARDASWNKTAFQNSKMDKVFVNGVSQSF